MQGVCLLSVATSEISQEKPSSSASGHHIELPFFCAQAELCAEVIDMTKKMAAAGMQLLVIDTENKFVSTGFAEEIAKAAGTFGKYYYLPNASESAIAAAASGAMAAAKMM